MYSIYLASMSLPIILIFFFVTDFGLQKALNVTNKQNNQNFLSTFHTNCLKGLGAILVVFSHIGYPNFNRFWGFTGGVAVCLFLFCSGYGVNESYKRNGLKNYFLKRIIFTSIPYWLITILMWFMYQPQLSVWGYLKQLLFIDAHFFWFIQFLIVQYLFFYVVKRFIKSPKGQFRVLVLVNLGIFILNPSMSWGSQVLSFAIGYFVSEHKIKTYLVRDKRLLLYTIIGLFIGVFCLAIKQLDVIRNSHYLLLNFNQMIHYLSLTFAIVMLSYYTINWKLWQGLYFSGRYSFNIYLVSWLILVETIADIQPGFSSIVNYCIITTIAVIIFSFITTFINQQLSHLMNISK